MIHCMCESWYASLMSGRATLKSNLRRCVLRKLALRPQSSQSVPDAHGTNSTLPQPVRRPVVRLTDIVAQEALPNAM